MNPQLEGFFVDLRTEENLDRLVQERHEEDLYLEFKEKAEQSHGNLDDPDRKSFSKAVSGFANADGGILIFGMATTNSRDNPDRASALKPIANAERFRAKLLDSILNTTQPPVDGVRVEVVPSVRAEDGYVKCLIPASDSGPHRAIQAGREYWRRTTNGFRRMEHYELEDVFGRRLRPVLRLKVQLVPRPDPTDPHAELRFFLLNEGRGLARHVGLTCRMMGDAKVIAVRGNRLTNISPLNANQPVVEYYDAQSVVHPHGMWIAIGHALIEHPDKGKPVSVGLTWYAENMNTKTATVEVQPNNPIRLE